MKGITAGLRSRTAQLGLWALCAVTVMVANAPVRADDGVNIIDLGGLGGRASRATWMNDNGWVIGYSTSDSSPVGAVDTPFVYRPGVGIRKLTYGNSGQLTVEVINNGGVVAGEVPDPLIQNKPFIWTSAHGFIINDNMPTDWWPSYIRGINSAGIVAGWSQDENALPRPFRWNPGGKTEALAVPAGTYEAYAEGINHGGQVSGFCRDYAGYYHAVVWEANGQMTHVGPPPGTDGGSNVRALGINDNGLVAGVWYPSSGPSLFVWSKPKGFRNIGVLPGGHDLYFYRLSINNSGQIAGTLFDASLNQVPFIWDSVNGFRTPAAIGAQFSTNQPLGNLNNFGQVCGQSVNGFAAIAGGDSMTELGTLGGNSSEGVALNDRGMVVGNATGLIGGSAQAFIWDGSSMLGLPVPGGGYQPAGINSSGTVLVQVYGSASVWDSVHGLSQIPDLGGGIVSAAGINDRGIVAGVSLGSDDFFHPFLFDTNTGTHGLGFSLGYYYVYVSGVNNANQMVGNNYDDFGQYQAFILDPIAGVTVLPPDFSGNPVDPTGINDRGQISCYGAVFGSDGYLYSHGYLFDPTAGFIDLGVLPGGSFSSARNLNKYGQVIGIGDTSDGSRHPLITNSNVWMDLNDVVAPSQKWVISNAASINKNGQITGYGYHQGRYRAFLMTPKAKIKTFTLAASSLKGGSSTTGTVTLTQTAPYDLFVELKSDTGKVAVPEYVAIRKGGTSATFTVTTSSVTALTTAHITALFANTPFARPLQIKK